MSFADASSSLREYFGENDPEKLFALKPMTASREPHNLADPQPSLTHGFRFRYRFLSLFIRFDEEARSILFWANDMVEAGFHFSSFATRL
jgi:hypothetical protein